MNVLSLFDGISACRLALERAGHKVDNYYTAEIDKYAQQISEKNYPDAIRLGDVTKWQDWDIDWSSIDLVTGGSPCQSWSVAGKQLGDKDPRGMLFWTMLDIMKMVLKHNPKAYFLIENVKMKKEFEKYITHHTEQALGHVNKHLINSALVSAQNRQRYYWTNIQGITQPEDKGILLADILENGDFADREKSLTITTRIAGATAKRYLEKSMHQMAIKVCNVNPSGRGMNGNVYDANSDKSPCLTTNKGEGIKITGGAIRGRYIVDGKRQDHKMKTAGLTEQRLEVRNDGKTNALTTVQKDNVVVYDDIQYRKLTPLECERLQTFSDNWTLIVDENGKQLVSNSQRYKALGNAWTVDVIAHIFGHLK